MVTFKFYDFHLKCDYSVSILDDFVEDFKTLILDFKRNFFSSIKILILDNSDNGVFNVIINQSDDFLFDFTSAVFCIARLNKYIDPVIEVD